MRLPDEPSNDLRVVQGLPNTWDTIHRIEKTLNLSSSRLCDLLQLTSKELEKARITRKDLSADRIFTLAEGLDIGFNAIVSGDIDYQALSQHHLGNKTHLPERYSTAAFSRRRTTLQILNYVEKMFGWKERLYILRNFQLNEAIFANPDGEISFTFASDLCEYLKRYKLNNEALSQIGIECFLPTNHHSVKNELSDCRTVGQIYEKLCMELVPKYFEKNFVYEVTKIKDGTCYITIRPTSMFKDMLNVKTVATPATSTVRGGILAASPKIFGLPHARVLQTSCIYHGSPAIQYEVNFSLAESLFSFDRMRGEAVYH